jgi:opacity protein-like surface antigen
MRRLLYTASLAVLLATAANAQDWSKMSREEITRNGKSTIAVGKEGTAFVAYQNTDNYSSLSVARIKNGKLSQIGSGLSKGMAVDMTIITAPNGDPVAACIDDRNYTVTVHRMQDGKRWTALGNGPITADKVYGFGLAFDNKGDLYAAIGNSTQKTTVVYKLENDNWKEISLMEGGASGQIKLAFDSKNQLIMAYAHPKDKTAVVMVLKGTKWETLGGAPASAKEVKFLNLAIHNDNPIIAYSNYYTGALEVQELIKNKWGSIGAAVQMGSNDATGLALAADGTPYVSFHSTKSGHQTIVKGFIDGEWKQVGDLKTTFGGDSGYYTSLQYNKEDNKLYLCTKADGVGASVVTTAL